MAYRNDLTARELRRTGQFGRVLCAVLASGYILAVVILPNGLASAPDRGTPSKQSADSQSTRANSPNPQTAAKKELTFRPNGNSDVYDPYGSSLFVSQSFEASNGE